MAAHNEIRICFSVEDRRFEAVGFLDRGDELITIEVALARIKQSGRTITDFEDELLIHKNSKQIPESLWKNQLLTEARHRANERYTSRLSRSINGKWSRRWMNSASMCRQTYLVVCKRP